MCMLNDNPKYCHIFSILIYYHLTVLFFVQG